MDDWSHFASIRFTPGTEKYKGYFDTGNSKVDTITTLFKTPSCEWSSFKQALEDLHLMFEETVLSFKGQNHNSFLKQTKAKPPKKPLSVTTAAHCLKEK